MGQPHGVMKFDQFGSKKNSIFNLNSYFSDDPVCLPSEVNYLPTEESIARQTGWMRVAVAKSLVMYLAAMESCKSFIRFVMNRRQIGKAGTENRNQY